MEENVTIKKGIKTVWKHVRPFRGKIFLLSALGIVSAIANGFVPFVTGRFFDALIGLSQGNTNGEGIPLWLFFLLLWGFIQLVANNIDWVIDRIGRIVQIKAHMTFQVNGFRQLYLLPLSFHKTVQINEAIEQINMAGWRMAAIMRTVISIAPQFLSILIGIVLAASINTTLAAVLAAGVLLYVLLLIIILRPIAQIDSNAHRHWNEGWGDAAAAAHQIETVKQAASEDYETKKTERAILKRAYKDWVRLEYIWNNISFFQRIIVFATQLTVFILSVRFIAEGVISVGELVALNGYALMFFGPFVTLGHSWQIVQNGLSAALRAEQVYGSKTEEYMPTDVESPESFTGAVSFQNVSFRYTNKQKMILENISFSTEAGETIALVGESGVGKSTLIALLSGYYFPIDGSVTIDGVDTRKFDLIKLRKRIAVVPQEVALFNDTVRNNLRYGSFEATEEDVERVVEQSSSTDFIKKLPDGYDTLVGERGVKLSVGQKQRVAIARAILREPTILILDEPTSALDAKTEQVVTESLEKLMKGRTTFIIAHRLSTVRKADKILVFEKGRIVEEGKHDDLIKIENGVYRKLYEYQIGLH